jgi:diguanylate cyclase (GGDEF)-like protein
MKQDDMPSFHRVRLYQSLQFSREKMKYRKLIHFLQNIGKDPDSLNFEDSLTGLGNRRRLFRYFENETDWHNLHLHPLCLLMIGIDSLDQINLLYGRQAGDEALVHISGIMASMAEHKDILIRYGAAELIMLLPGKSKQAGLVLARALASALEHNPFFSSHTGLQIPLSMAIGIAGAPDDGDHGQLLINRADTALHLAKKNGPNGIVDASDAGRLAIRYVHSAGIVGRKSLFDDVSAAFKELGKGKNQFFIINGEPGMGKTCFIDAVQRNLEKTRLKPVRVRGVIQEIFRPYYLISYIITALMNQQEDKGIAIIESIGKKDLACLVHVIPQLSDDNRLLAPGHYPVSAGAVFGALSRFFIKLTHNRTLVVLIDDFHLADPASLDIIHELMTSGKKPALFICATASIGEKEQSTALPLDLFRTAYTERLDIRNVFLNPLTQSDISKYINLIFPGIILPDDLPEELALVTGGNPLFLVAIIIKMIEERRIIQHESRWTVAELNDGYFPGSFEQIIREKLDSLDGDDKKFIDRLSGFGESAPLSMLEGFTQQESYKIYEILKGAVKHGLMRSEFRENDESIRFSSKLVREVVYNRIGEEEKRKLHEEIGLYHEKLYFQNVLPSAAFLVHHFKHSGNIEKAVTYEQLMTSRNKSVYGNQINTSLDNSGTGNEIAAAPLSDHGLAIIPEMLHNFALLVRNFRLYPERSKSVIILADRLAHLVSEILETNDRLSIIAEKNLLLINSQPIDTSGFTAAATRILDLWNRLELKSLTLKRGFTKKELTSLVKQIGKMENKAVTPGYWKRFAEEGNLVNIFPGQIGYARVEPEGSREDITDLMAYDSTRYETECVHQFDDAETKAIKHIIGSLLSAINKIRFYPTRGQVATKAVFRVVTELHAFLNTWPVFTIARVDNRLLINGIKIDTSEFENTADGILKLLTSSGLHSLSFTSRVNANEIVEFLKTACQLSSSAALDPVFWQNAAAQRQINGILFNQNIYDVITPEDGKTKQDKKKSMAARGIKLPEPDDADMPARAHELYLKGDIRGLEALFTWATAAYAGADEMKKFKIITLFDNFLFPANWHPNAAFIKLAANHVLTLLAAEDKPDLQDKLFELCHKAAKAFILFGEYTFAAWIYLGTSARYAAAFPPGKKKIIEVCSEGDIRIFDRPLGSEVVAALSEDLRKGDRSRQQETAQLLSTMGSGTIPLLIDLIKESEDLRVRRLSADLIAKHGKHGETMIKAAFAQTWRHEQKTRILEVIDSITTDLSMEMTSAISDPDENVRRSAFKLIERVSTPEALALLKIAAAPDGDSQTALLAINAMVRLKPDFLADTLATLSRESNDQDILIASCRAMGQSGESAYTVPLSEILFPKRRFLGRKKYDTAVRVAAAFALAQIAGEKAGSIIQGLKKDRDPRVREVVNRYYPQ